MAGWIRSGATRQRRAWRWPGDFLILGRLWKFTGRRQAKAITRFAPAPIRAPSKPPTIDDWADDSSRDLSTPKT
jgi:hypothetical protein